MAISPPRLRICLPCPPPKAGPGGIWGDYFFGQSLGRGFEALGLSTSYAFQVKRGWGRKGRRASRHWHAGATVDLVIRGLAPYAAVPSRPQFIWLISHFDTITEAEIAGARHIFVASRPACEALQARGASASYLPQCADTTRFFPRPPEPALTTELLFVGNRRKGAPRPSVRLARATGRDVAVWGSGWHGRVPAHTHRGTFIENADLGRHYASAGAVLNDHHRLMRRAGAVSNRVYDVLACARPILTEAMDDLPPDLAGGLFAYTTADFADAADRALAADQRALQETAACVAAHHSFQHRAANILSVIRS